MIKVLIVDDDKLVRKGLISSMPWQTFEMEVVGEASNGEMALEFLQTNEIDLLMLDLAMPVMSGIELMQHVSQRYPHIHIVVLTFHQDFAYIQEALRFGAIDYIAKVQLEKEKFDEVLNRISELIKRKRSQGGVPELQRSSSEAYQSDEGIALITTDEQPNIQWMQAIDLEVCNPDEIGTRLWFWVPNDPLECEKVLPTLVKAIEKGGNWFILRLSGLKGEKKSVVPRTLRGYREKVLFYEYESTQRVISKSLAEITSQQPGPNESDLLCIKEKWLAFKWIYKASLFEELLEELKKLRMPASRLMPLMSAVEHDLIRLCGAINVLQTEPLSTVTNWYELEHWLRDLRDQAYKTICRQPYSEDVVRCIFEALNIINNEIYSELTALNIAKRVNLSRSYFSQCFKDITGRPFNDYLRHTRMDRAKEYLTKTNQPISWVAERIGYLDEKYFSHVFKLQTGMLPSEYRRSAS